jgi:hypothetical protein
VYRTPAEKAPEDRPPRELVYDALDESRSGSQIALFQYFGLPILAGLALGAFTGSTGGLLGLLGGAGYSAWSWRGRKKAGGAVLRVDDGVLSVTVRGPKERNERLRLDDLANVTLDIKTIERVTEGDSAIPAMRFIDAKVGPKVDTARIVLVSAGGRQVHLTEDYLAHMSATEWLGKIRVFLRKHGWLPEDERESDGVDSEG